MSVAFTAVGACENSILICARKFMAALISIRFDKHILSYKTNYPIGAPLRREAVRVIGIFLAKGRELDMKDIMRGRMDFSKSSGCMRGFKFCLSSTICSLSDCGLQIPPFHFKPLK